MKQCQTVKKQTLKAIAFFVLISFTLLNTSQNSFTYASLPDSSASHHGIKANPSALLGSFELPEALGIIQERFIPESLSQIPDKFVIYVQSAHTNYDSEFNTKKLIEFFQKEYGLDLVLLEGGAGSLDSLFFKSFPDQEAKQRILADYLKVGDLSGGEIASILNEDADTKYHGVEDPSLYEANKSTFLKAIEKEKEITLELDKIQAQLDERVKNVSEPAQTFLELESKFRNEEMHVMEYLESLGRLHSFDSINERYPELNKILKIKDVEKQSKNEGVDATVTRLLKSFQEQVLPKLPKDQRMEMNQMIQMYRLGHLSHGMLVKRIEELSKSQNFFFETPHALKPGVKQVQMISSIKGTKLFDELKSLEADLRRTLSKSDEERTLLAQFHKLETMRNFSRLELTYSEWKKMKDGGVNESLAALFSEHFKFYELAVKRDEALFENAIRAMDQEKSKLALISTGGFHSEGITAKLKSENIPYLLIAPKINQFENRNHYLKVMRDERSFMKYFQGSLWDALAKDYAAKLASTLKREELTPSLKRWRDRIIQNSIAEGRITESGTYTRYVDALVQALRKEYEKGSPLDFEIKPDHQDSIRFQLEKELESSLPSYFDRLESVLKSRLENLGSGLRDLWKTGNFTPNTISKVLNQANSPSSTLAAEIALIRIGEKASVPILGKIDIDDSTNVVENVANAIVEKIETGEFTIDQVKRAQAQLAVVGLNPITGLFANTGINEPTAHKILDMVQARTQNKEPESNRVRSEVRNEDRDEHQEPLEAVVRTFFAELNKLIKEVDLDEPEKLRKQIEWLGKRLEETGELELADFFVDPGKDPILNQWNKSIPYNGIALGLVRLNLTSLYEILKNYELDEYDSLPDEFTRLLSVAVLLLIHLQFTSDELETREIITHASQRIRQIRHIFDLATRLELQKTRAGQTRDLGIGIQKADKLEEAGIDLSSLETIPQLLSDLADLLELGSKGLEAFNQRAEDVIQWFDVSHIPERRKANPSNQGLNDQAESYFKPFRDQYEQMTLSALEPMDQASRFIYALEDIGTRLHRLGLNERYIRQVRKAIAHLTVVLRRTKGTYEMSQAKFRMAQKAFTGYLNEIPKRSEARAIADKSVREMLFEPLDSKKYDTTLKLINYYLKQIESFELKINRKLAGVPKSEKWADDVIESGHVRSELPRMKRISDYLISVLKGKPSNLSILSNQSEHLLEIDGYLRTVREAMASNGLESGPDREKNFFLTRLQAISKKAEEVFSLGEEKFPDYFSLRILTAVRSEAQENLGKPLSNEKNSLDQLQQWISSLRSEMRDDIAFQDPDGDLAVLLGIATDLVGDIEDYSQDYPDLFVELSYLAYLSEEFFKGDLSESELFELVSKQSKSLERVRSDLEELIKDWDDVPDLRPKEFYNALARLIQQGSRQVRSEARMPVPLRDGLVRLFGSDKEHEAFIKNMLKTTALGSVISMIHLNFFTEQPAPVSWNFGLFLIAGFSALLGWGIDDKVKESSQRRSYLFDQKFMIEGGNLKINRGITQEEIQDLAHLADNLFRSFKFYLEPFEKGGEIGNLSHPVLDGLDYIELVSKELLGRRITRSEFYQYIQQSEFLKHEAEIRKLTMTGGSFVELQGEVEQLFLILHQINSMRSEARVSADDLREEMLRKLEEFSANLAVRSLTEEEAKTVFDEFKNQLKSTRNLTKFNRKHLKNMSQYLEQATEVTALLNETTKLIMTSIPVEPSAIRGVKIFKISNHLTNVSQIVGYGFFSIGPESIKRNQPAAQIAFHIFKSFRSGRDSSIQFESKEIFEAFLADLNREHKVANFTLPAVSQITATSIGDPTLNALFYLKRGFYPRDQKDLADELLLRMNQGETLALDEIEPLLEPKPEFLPEPVSSPMWVFAVHRSEARTALGLLSNLRTKFEKRFLRKGQTSIDYAGQPGLTVRQVYDHFVSKEDRANVARIEIKSKEKWRQVGRKDWDQPLTLEIVRSDSPQDWASIRVYYRSETRQSEINDVIRRLLEHKSIQNNEELLLQVVLLLKAAAEHPGSYWARDSRTSLVELPYGFSEEAYRLIETVFKGKTNDLVLVQGVLDKLNQLPQVQGADQTRSQAQTERQERLLERISKRRSRPSGRAEARQGNFDSLRAVRPMAALRAIAAAKWRRIGIGATTVAFESTSFPDVIIKLVRPIGLVEGEKYTHEDVHSSAETVENSYGLAQDHWNQLQDLVGDFFMMEIPRELVKILESATGIKMAKEFRIAVIQKRYTTEDPLERRDIPFDQALADYLDRNLIHIFELFYQLYDRGFKYDDGIVFSDIGREKPEEGNLHLLDLGHLNVRSEPFDSELDALHFLRLIDQVMVKAKGRHSQAYEEYQKKRGAFVKRLIDGGILKSSKIQLSTGEEEPLPNEELEFLRQTYNQNYATKNTHLGLQWRAIDPDRGVGSIYEFDFLKSFVQKSVSLLGDQAPKLSSDRYASRQDVQMILGMFLNLGIISEREVKELTNAYDRLSEIGQYSFSSAGRLNEKQKRVYYENASAVFPAVPLLIVSLYRTLHPPELYQFAEPLDEHFEVQRDRSLGFDLNQGFQVHYHEEIALSQRHGDPNQFFSQYPYLMFKVFKHAAEGGLPISHDLKTALWRNRDHFQKWMVEQRTRQWMTPEVTQLHQTFLNILGKQDPVSEVLWEMDRLGFLSAYLPEYAAVRSLPSDFQIHAFTVGQHILYNLERLDALANFTQMKADEVLALRLSLLFHDQGKRWERKGADPDHAIRAAQEIVPVRAREMGLGNKLTEAVIWLVRNHMMLNELVRHEQFVELRPLVLENFLDDPSLSKELFDMLFLISLTDRSSVNPFEKDKINLTAEQERIERLRQFRSDLLDWFETTPDYRHRHLEHLKALAWVRLGEEKERFKKAYSESLKPDLRNKGLIQEYLDEIMPEATSQVKKEIARKINSKIGRYLRNNGTYSHLLDHLLFQFPVNYLFDLGRHYGNASPIFRRLLFLIHLEILREEGKQTPLFLFETLNRFYERQYEVTVGIPKDVPKLLLNMVAALTASNFSFQGADIRTARDGTVVDRFSGFVIDGLDPKQFNSILSADLTELVTSDHPPSIKELFERKETPYRSRRTGAEHELKVQFLSDREENGESFSIVNIQTPDRIGLFLLILLLGDRHNFHFHEGPVVVFPSAVSVNFNVYRLAPDGSKRAFTDNEKEAFNRGLLRLDLNRDEIGFDELEPRAMVEDEIRRELEQNIVYDPRKKIQRLHFLIEAMSQLSPDHPLYQEVKGRILQNRNPGWSGVHDLDALQKLHDLYDFSWPPHKQDDFSEVFLHIRKQGFLMSGGNDILRLDVVREGENALYFIPGKPKLYERQLVQAKIGGQVFSHPGVLSNEALFIYHALFQRDYNDTLSLRNPRDEETAELKSRAEVRQTDSQTEPQWTRSENALRALMVVGLAGLFGFLEIWAEFWVVILALPLIYPSLWKAPLEFFKGISQKPQPVVGQPTFYEQLLEVAESDAQQRSEVRLSNEQTDLGQKSAEIFQALISTWKEYAGIEESVNVEVRLNTSSPAWLLSLHDINVIGPIFGLHFDTIFELMTGQPQKRLNLRIVGTHPDYQGKNLFPLAILALLHAYPQIEEISFWASNESAQKTIGNLVTLDFLGPLQKEAHRSGVERLVAQVNRGEVDSRLGLFIQDPIHLKLFLDQLHELKSKTALVRSEMRAQKADEIVRKLMEGINTKRHPRKTQAEIFLEVIRSLEEIQTPAYGGYTEWMNRQMHANRFVLLGIITSAFESADGNNPELVTDVYEKLYGELQKGFKKTSDRRSEARMEQELEADKPEKILAPPVFSLSEIDGRVMDDVSLDLAPRALASIIQELSIRYYELQSKFRGTFMSARDVIGVVDFVDEDSVSIVLAPGLVERDGTVSLLAHDELASVIGLEKRFPGYVQLSLSLGDENRGRIFYNFDPRSLKEDDGFLVADLAHNEVINTGRLLLAALRVLEQSNEESFGLLADPREDARAKQFSDLFGPVMIDELKLEPENPSSDLSLKKLADLELIEELDALEVQSLTGGFKSFPKRVWLAQLKEVYNQLSLVKDTSSLSVIATIESYLENGELKPALDNIERILRSINRTISGTETDEHKRILEEQKEILNDILEKLKKRMHPSRAEARGGNARFREIRNRYAEALRQNQIFYPKTFNNIAYQLTRQAFRHPEAFEENSAVTVIDSVNQYTYELKRKNIHELWNALSDTLTVEAKTRQLDGYGYFSDESYQKLKDFESELTKRESIQRLREREGYRNQGISLSDAQKRFIINLLAEGYAYQAMGYLAWPEDPSRARAEARSKFKEEFKIFISLADKDGFGVITLAGRQFKIQFNRRGDVWKIKEGEWSDWVDIDIQNSAYGRFVKDLFSYLSTNYHFDSDQPLELSVIYRADAIEVRGVHGRSSPNFVHSFVRFKNADTVSEILTFSRDSMLDISLNLEPPVKEIMAQKLLKPLFFLPAVWREDTRARALQAFQTEDFGKSIRLLNTIINPVRSEARDSQRQELIKILNKLRTESVRSRNSRTHEDDYWLAERLDHVEKMIQSNSRKSRLFLAAHELLEIEHSIAVTQMYELHPKRLPILRKLRQELEMASMPSGFRQLISQLQRDTKEDHRQKLYQLDRFLSKAYGVTWAQAIERMRTAHSYERYEYQYPESEWQSAIEQNELKPFMESLLRINFDPTFESRYDIHVPRKNITRTLALLINRFSRLADTRSEARISDAVNRLTDFMRGREIDRQDLAVRIHTVVQDEVALDQLLLFAQNALLKDRGPVSQALISRLIFIERQGDATQAQVRLTFQDVMKEFKFEQEIIDLVLADPKVKETFSGIANALNQTAQAETQIKSVASISEISKETANLAKALFNAIVSVNRTTVVAYHLSRNAFDGIELDARPAVLGSLAKTAADAVGTNKYIVINLILPSGEAARLTNIRDLVKTGDVRRLQTGNVVRFVNTGNPNYLKASDLQPVIVVVERQAQVASDYVLSSSKYADGSSIILNGDLPGKLLIAALAYVALSQETVDFLAQIDSNTLQVRNRAALEELSHLIKLMLDTAREQALTAKAA